MYRNDELWNKNFDVFKEYIKNPKNTTFSVTTIYKGVKIGNWYRHQLNEYKNCSLPFERSKSLKEFYPKWFDYQSLKKHYKIVYEKSNKDFAWVFTLKVESDKAFDFIVTNNIKDSKELFNFIVKHQSNFRLLSRSEKEELKFGAFKHVTSVSIATYKLLSKLYDFDDFSSKKNPIYYCNEKIRSFVKPEEELIYRIKMIFSYLLNEKCYNIFFSTYDLKNNNINTYQAVSNEYKITRERVRQISNAAITKFKDTDVLKKLLLCPYKDIVIDLPKDFFSYKTIETLFKNEIFTMKNLENTSADELKSIYAMSFTAYKQINEYLSTLNSNCYKFKRRKRYAKAKNESNMFEPIVFTNRTKNALLRNKIDSIDSILNSICEIPKLRGIGKETINEIYDKLNKEGYSYIIPEQKKYFFNPEFVDEIKQN